MKRFASAIIDKIISMQGSTMLMWLFLRSASKKVAIPIMSKPISNTYAAGVTPNKRHTAKAPKMISVRMVDCSFNIVRSLLDRCQISPEMGQRLSSWENRLRNTDFLRLRHLQSQRKRRCGTSTYWDQVQHYKCIGT